MAIWENCCIIGLLKELECEIMSVKKLNLVGIMLLLLLALSGCDKEKNRETGKEAFCLYLNSENMDKTVPVINDYLEGQKSDLNDEQKVQALTEWLKLCPCVIDVTILSVSGIYTLPAQSEIRISFEENGKTEDFILDISMSNPLRATGYHEHN